MNKYINLTPLNVEEEHLCCAISDKKHQEGVNNKKNWLKDRIKEGHVFRKLDANGKIFIEYAPLEKAWVPISGNNFFYIYCLWVAGSYKEKGYGKELLEYAINEAKKQGKNGICVVTSKKKKPYLSDKSFFLHFGFKVVDSILDYELLSLSFNDEVPKFNENARKMKIDKKELTIYYTRQCPYINNCIKELKEFSEEKNIPINFVFVDTLEKAKNMNCVFNNYANFKDGVYLSNLLLNRNMVEKLYK